MSVFARKEPTELKRELAPLRTAQVDLLTNSNVMTEDVRNWAENAGHSNYRHPFMRASWVVCTTTVATEPGLTNFRHAHAIKLLINLMDG
ncbi:hypothetical protein NX059_010703 [Plenodomus lindquistii]|nr:hypothetical protein NX059_010703 [Plenodomus lindquistii]